MTKKDKKPVDCGMCEGEAIEAQESDNLYICVSEDCPIFLVPLSERQHEKINDFILRIY